MTERQKILIVDDRKENLVALRQVLREVDAEIVEATSGNEALAATLNHEFALAILDVQMPGMNGYELAEHLRGDKKTQDDTDRVPYRRLRGREAHIQGLRGRRRRLPVEALLAGCNAGKGERVPQNGPRQAGPGDAPRPSRNTGRGADNAAERADQGAQLPLCRLRTFSRDRADQSTRR